MTNFNPALSPAAIDQLVNQSLAIAEQAEKRALEAYAQALMLRFASLRKDELSDFLEEQSAHINPEAGPEGWRVEDTDG